MTERAQRVTSADIALSPAIKSCARCHQLKPAGVSNPASAFPIQKDSRNGHQILRESPWCSACHADYHKGWWRKKRAQIARRILRA